MIKLLRRLASCSHYYLYLYLTNKDKGFDAKIFYLTKCMKKMYEILVNKKHDYISDLKLQYGITDTESLYNLTK
jgi:hypothetical protein